MTDSTHPPKPAVAFRVGVTGHRAARLDPGHTARINAEVRAILEEVSAAVSASHEKHQAAYNDAPPKLYFVSALADGADTLAAQRALDSNWRLLAPLPFLKDWYADDFAPNDLNALNALLDRAEAVAELDGVRHGQSAKDHRSGGLEDRSYLQAGIVTIHQSDFLIAIWDGEEARGLGGTAMIMDEALAAGKRVVWVNAVSDKQPVFLDAEGVETPFTAEAVRKAVEFVLAPPPYEEIEHAFSGKQTHALTAYENFMEETPKSFNYGSFFQFWEKLIAGQSILGIKLRAPSVDDEIRKMREETLAVRIGASERDRQVFDDIIIPRFCWADRLAIHYGNLYRSSYFFNYIFAAMAVFLALFDLVAGFGSKTIWISIEVSIILAILFVTTSGKRGRWHEKWIDYRQLAEEMRQFRNLYLTIGRGPRGDDPVQGEGGEAAGWVDWYVAATRREAGLTSSRFDTDTLRSIAKRILNDEIRPQIEYHNKKAGTLHKIEHRLHILGEYAFGITLLVCLAYLSLVALAANDGSLHDFAYKAKKLAKGWVTMLTGFLPAIGAAFFGIRVQGEFGSTAERSHATAAQLTTIASSFEHLINEKSPRLEMLQFRVEEAARAMLMENMDWRMLYISRPLNLPG